MYSGHIYDKEGTPLCNYKVSDGLNIAITDEHGAYSLPGWERANVISVQALTQNHDDWYRYIDKDTDQYDFYISPYIPNNSEVSFLHFSDTEIFLDGAYPHLWIDFVKSTVSETSPGFIIHTGDICRRKGLEYHRIAMNSQNMGVPVRYTLGNHDYVADKYGEYTFERLYGPVWYSFDLGNTHFVILPITQGEVAGLYTPEDSARWLKKDLTLKDKDKKVVIFCHDINAEFEKGEEFRSGEEAVDLMSYNALAWVFGHYHTNYLKQIDGKHHIGTGRPDFGGIDGTPAACRCVKISEDGSLSTKLYFNEIKSAKNCEAKRTKLGNNICFTKPIYANGSVFAATFSSDTSKKGRICKLSKDGDLIDHVDTDSAVKWNMAYYDGMLYAFDDHGTVYYINADSFDIIRKIHITTQALPIYNGGVVVDDGRLYVATNSLIYELDCKSGDTLRVINDLQSIGISSTSEALFTREMIIKGKHWRGISAISRASGEALWFNTDASDTIASPIEVDDHIIMPTRYRVIKINFRGETVKESPRHSECFYNVEAKAVCHEGKLYVPTAEAGIMVLDNKTLEELYTFDCEGSLIAAASYAGIGSKSTFGTPIIKNGSLIFTAADGHVYFYDINTRNLKRRVNIGHPILSGACEIDGGYCVADFDGGISFIEE